MTHQTYPRSAKVLLGGIAHLGRFIDKIRLRHAGQIQDYNYITVGFDKYLRMTMRLASGFGFDFKRLRASAALQSSLFLP